MAIKRVHYKKIIFAERNVSFQSVPKMSSIYPVIMKNVKPLPTLVIKSGSALREIERKNTVLEGALPDNNYFRLHMGLSGLSPCLDLILINRLKLKAGSGKDIFGKVYEYCLRQFALKDTKKCAQWAFIMENVKQPDLSIKIDPALHEIKRKNPALEGALPDNYHFRLHMTSSGLSSLLELINGMEIQVSGDKDIFVKVYEYCLRRFALKERGVLNAPYRCFPAL